MDTWTLFQFLYETFDVQFLTAVNTNANNLLSALTAPLIVGVTVWLAGTMAIELYSPGAEPLMLFVRKLIRAALVVGLITAAAYATIFEQFVLTTLPNELTAAITGNQSAGALTPDAFDKLLQGGWVSVVLILKNVSAWNPQSVILALLAVIEFGIGGLFIAVGFLVFIASHIMLGLTITVGPLLVCALLWDKTVYLFNAWISTILSLVLTQVLIVSLLALLLRTENNLLQQMVAANSAGGVNFNDIGGQVHYFMESALLYFMIGYLSPKIAELAQSLTRGAAPGIAGASQMAHGMLGSAASRVGQDAAAGAQAASGATLSGGKAAMRSLTPAGKALG
jgi:type IV secretory pathway VirB6-like protein